MRHHPRTSRVFPKRDSSIDVTIFFVRIVRNYCDNKLLGSSFP
eukprot:UN20754